MINGIFCAVEERLELGQVVANFAVSRTAFFERQRQSQL